MSSHRNILVVILVFSIVSIYPAKSLFAADNATIQIIEDLQEAAQKCMDQKNYTAARDKYQQIIRYYPNAIWSQYSLIKALLCLNDITAANAETEKLLSNYTADPNIAVAVRRVADSYREGRHYAQASQLYQTIANQWPNHPDMMWCRRNLAYLQIEQKDMAGAKFTTEKLLSDYAKRRNVARAARHVADYYRKSRHYAEAAQLYQTVINKHPNSLEVMQCQHNLVYSLLDMGDTTGAKAAADNLLSKYAADSNVAGVVRRVADSCCKGRHYTEATQLYQTVIEKYPDSPETMRCQHNLVYSLLAQGDITGSKAAADKLLSNYAAEPNTAKIVRKIADSYRKDRHYAEAAQLYQTIVDKYPDSSEVMRCQHNLVYSLLEQGDIAGSKAAADKLLSNYAAEPNTAKIVRKIADSYRKGRHYAEAAQLYQTIVDKHPDSPEVVRCQRSLACSLLEQGDITGSKAAVEKLLSNYATEPNVAGAILEVADVYYKAQRYEDALALYRKVLELKPSKREQDYANGGIVRICVQQDDETAAYQKIDSILNSDVNTVDAGIAQELIRIGEGYYMRAGNMENKDKAKDYYQKSLDYYQKSAKLIDSNIFDSNLAGRFKAAAYYGLGLNYQQLGDYLKAAESFAIVYQSNPGMEYVDYCLFAAGNCYKQQVLNKLISEKEGNVKIKSYYQQLVASYPRSRYVPTANEWLRRNN